VARPGELGRAAVTLELDGRGVDAGGADGGWLVTRAEILACAASPGGLLDAPRAWSIDTLATVMQLEAEGLISAQTVEFHWNKHRMRMTAWFTTDAARAFTDEETR